METKELLEFVEKKKEKARKQKAAQALKNSPVESPEKSPPKTSHLTTPGVAQATVMARMADSPNNGDAILQISQDMLDSYVRLKETSEHGSLPELEMLLMSQATMFSNLSCHFLTKAMVGYDSAELMMSLPEVLSEFANLALKFQAESRKCIALLNEIKNPKRKAVFIKNQLNQVNLDNQTQLEPSNYASVDIPSQRETAPVNLKVEALGE